MQLATLQVTCEGPVVLRHSFSTALPFNLVTLYTTRFDLSIGFSKKIQKISKNGKNARKLRCFVGEERRHYADEGMKTRSRRALARQSE